MFYPAGGRTKHTNHEPCGSSVSCVRGGRIKSAVVTTVDVSGYRHCYTKLNIFFK